MYPTTLILCQGLQISKIIAAILSHSPQECVILRSYSDISDKVKVDIDRAIVRVLDYIDENMTFFPNLKRIFEVQADIFNPNSIVRSLEKMLDDGSLSGTDLVIDLSTGPIPANIGLYLFALKHQVKDLTFCFPGERYAETKHLYPSEKFQKEIEFAREFQFFVPLMLTRFRSLNEEILIALDEAGGRVQSLYELSERLHQPDSPKHLMALSRECDKLAAIGLITSKRIGKSKELRLTSSGRQYIAYKKYPEPQIKVIWRKRH